MRHDEREELQHDREKQPFICFYEEVVFSVKQKPLSNKRVSHSLTHLLFSGVSPENRPVLIQNMYFCWSRVTKNIVSSGY